MEAIALKAMFDALETFGPMSVILAGALYLVWRGETTRAKKALDAEARSIKAMEALAKSNNRLADNFDHNIRVVEGIKAHMDEIKAVLHRLSELGAELKGSMK